MSRHSNLLSLQILTTFLIISSCPQILMSQKVETQTLLEFKKHLIDPLKFLESWKDSDPHCNFSGVVCDQETGIALSNRSLSGIIPPSISLLKNLKALNVSDNYINATVPDLSGLTNLEILDLSDNYFSGPFPGWVGNLTGLTSLSLGDNDYDEGEIPDTLGNLKNLTYLYLAGSNLKGRIPESIFGLGKLGTLDISNNMISGEFPASIVKLKNLFKIELFQNNLTGEIPEGLAGLTLLQEFDVSANQLFGEIPQRIGHLKKLTVFQVYKNNLSGEIPAGFGEMKHLVAFSIYLNRFTGEFPQNFGKFSPLNTFDISENQFTGPFPKYLCRNRSLTYLLVLDNYFSGGFPEDYADCTSLRRLRVSNNHLNGSILDRVWALPNLDVLDFTENNFSGEISPLIGGSSQLKQLMLSSNKFSGKLPTEIGNLTQLERIYLNDNKFSGEIPSELGDLKQITSLQMEGNAFSGTIPSQLSNCPRLADLNLGSNFLSGNIPNSFSKMATLNSLNLSGNVLTGPIPDSFDRLRLSSIDLSNNRLSGRVPPYFLTVAGDKALFGNKNLCVEKNESNKRFVNSELGFCEGKTSHENLLWSKRVVFMVILVLVVLLGILLLVRYHYMRRGIHENNTSDENVLIDSLNWRLESFQKNEFDPDDICKMDEENLIGSGSTGEVYRVDLKGGSGSVAVKRLWKGSGAKTMEVEMGIMAKIRHRNILELYACLTRGGSRFLIFKYMENGNLSEALHRETKFGVSELDWSQRYIIALGVARGISYLHHDCCPPIIHRDIKSTNILLDEDYEAKIADFGVAKVADGVSTGGSEMSCFAGTHGYIAPEMAYTLKLTEKSDVYSFGVVMMELVTGKRPVEEEYGDGRDIVYHVSTHLDSKESVVRILDRKVVSEQDEDDMIKVLRISTLCTAKLPNQRPSMKEVVKMLVDAEPCARKSEVDFRKK